MFFQYELNILPNYTKEIVNRLLGFPFSSMHIFMCKVSSCHLLSSFLTLNSTYEMNDWNEWLKNIAANSNVIAFSAHFVTFADTSFLHF